MNLPRSVADVLDDHVVFEVECIDRMYCNVYMPGLQYAAGLVSYVHQQLGLPIASTAPLAKISDRFSAAVHRFARDHDVPWANFVNGPAQGRRDARVPGPVHSRPGRGVHRPGRARARSSSLGALPLSGRTLAVFGSFARRRTRPAAHGRIPPVAGGGSGVAIAVARGRRPTSATATAVS